MEPKIYTRKEFSELIHVSISTLKRWDVQGLLVAKRTIANRPFYTQKQYEEYIARFKDE